MRAVPVSGEDRGREAEEEQVVPRGDERLRLHSEAGEEEAAVERRDHPDGGLADVQDGERGARVCSSS